MKCFAPIVRSRVRQGAWACACTECLPRKMRKYLACVEIKVNVNLEDLENALRNAFCNAK